MSFKNDINEIIIMKKLGRILLFCIFFISANNLYAANRYWIASGNGNWNDINNWSTSSTGVGGATVPIIGDFVYFTSNGLGNCTIDIAAVFDGISTTGYTGTIDLNGSVFNPSVGGTANITFNDLHIIDGSASTNLSYTTTGQTSFNGGTYDIEINLICGSVDFNGGTFNSAVDVEDNGGSSANGAGGCTFNSTLKITNSGTSYFLMGQTNPDIFNDDVTLINTSTSRIRMAYGATGTQFNGNIIIGSTNGSGIWIGETGGTSSMASGKIISIDPIGFNDGEMRFQNFSQLGTSAQNFSLSANAILRIQSGTVFNGSIDIDAPRIYLDGATFNNLVDIEKTGAGSDASTGGNVFTSNVTLTNSSDGYFMMGNGNPDDFQANLTFNNLGSNNCYLANNSTGNSITGDLNITNATSGTNTSFYISNGTASTITIGGNCTILNNPTANNGSVYLGENGDVNILGNLIATNSPLDLNGHIYIGNQTNSNIAITGNTTLTNNGTQTTSRIYFGSQGSVQQNGSLTIVNNSSANNSQIYCNNGANSNNTYGTSIFVSSTQNNTDGVLFGAGNGTAVLASGQTISLGVGGFVAGDLYLRNFSVLGNANQNLALTNTSTLTLLDCSFGGNIDFSAPRITVTGTTVNGTSNIEKTAGFGNDLSYGGNKFIGDATFTNAGDTYLGLAYINPDSCMGNVTCNNTGEDFIYLFYNSTGNYIGGNLTANNTASGNNSGIYVGYAGASSFDIIGNCSLENNATSTTSNCALGNSSDFTIGGTLSAINNGAGTTANFYVGNTGVFSIGGTATLSNISSATNASYYISNTATSQGTFNGAVTLLNTGALNTSQIYVGNNGDNIFNATVNIKNSSAANNARIYLNQNVDANNQFNENIVLESNNVDADGIYFGNSNGSASLALGKTISIGPLNYIAGDLVLRNFTQQGNTAQNLTCLGTSYLTIYDSQWDGDVIFISPRLITQGSSYAETSYFEKTGDINDASAGGNSFMKDCEIRNTGTGYILMGNGNPDIWGANLITNNYGENNLYIAYNAIGNTIGGNLTSNHATTGGTSTYTYIGTAAISTLNIAGNCILNMTGASTNNYMSLAESGTISIGGNLTYTSTGTGNNSELRAAFNASSSLTVSGNTTITNTPSAISGNSYLAYSGVANLLGDFTLINGPTGNYGSFTMANANSAAITIGGNTALTSQQTAGITKQITFGNQGAVSCNGTLSIYNNSDATNNQIYCNSASGGVGTYTDNIVVETTHVDGDGVHFGINGGQATLAATKTISIGPGGFIAGNLTFRNFNQIGNTAQNITITGTAVFTNTDSDWGGAVDFSAPRMYSNGTHYNETSFIEKTGDQSDGSAGGNTFDKNCELKNSGTGYLLFGNGNPDVWGEDLFINNVGEQQMYIGYNSAGNTIAGNLTISNTSTGVAASTHIHLATATGSDITVSGLTNITNQSSSNSHYIYIGESGSIDFMNDVLINQNGNGNTANIQIAGNTNSIVNIFGNLTIQNDGADVNSNVVIASNGTVSITGDLTLTHSPTGLNGDLSLASGTNAAITVNGNTIITSGLTGGNVRTVYVGNNGTTTFDGTLSLINQSNANNSNFYCNNGANATGNYNDNIILECSDINGDGIAFGSGNGTGILATGKTVSISAGGFVAGRLYFRNFTQLGNTTQNLFATGTAYMTQYESNWGGPVNFSAPRMNTYGTHYHDLTYLEKTGSNSDMSNGGNQFDENTELRNTGDGYFGMSNGNPDIWNKNLIINNLGSNNMYIAFNATGNSIGGNLLVNNNGSGSNNTIYLSSYAASTLDIVGNTTVNNIGAANSSLIYYGASGDITTNGQATFYNNPSGSTGQITIAANNGSNLIFNDQVVFTNDNGSSTTQRIYIGAAGDCVFNNTVQINNNSLSTNSEIYCNYNASGTNYFMDNIEINNALSTADGIFFGAAGGYAELASGKTIAVGGGGFIDGTLYFRNFNQLGNTAQSISIAGSGRIENYNSVWNGNVDFRADDHYTRETIYNGTAYLEKNGSTNNASTGGNTFNQPAIIQNNGTGYFMPANGIGNDYDAAVTFNQMNTGVIYPCYNSISTFAGDISVNVPSTIFFGAAGNGRAVLDGTTAQSINAIGLSPNIQFRDLQVNNPIDEITLNAPIEIVTELDLDQGNIITNSTNLVMMTDNSYVSSVSDNSYVDGPISKRGNDAFAFPVGKGGFYRPINISAPSSGSAEFQAEYFLTDPHPTYDHASADPTIQHISSCEYWILDRTNTGNQVDVTLSWNNNTSCGVDNLSELVIARWDGSTWKDEGNGGTTGNTSNGTIISANSINNFSPFTLASTSINNPLPIELLNFDVQKDGQVAFITWETASEINNDYFKVQRAMDGENYYNIGIVQGAGNSSIINSYDFVDKNPFVGVNYYRLKQVDFDGSSTYTAIKTLDFYLLFDTDLILYPNPTTNSNTCKLINNGRLIIQTIEIYNEVGALVNRQIINEKASTLEIKTDSFAKGLYTVRIIGQQQSVTKKLIVQ